MISKVTAFYLLVGLVFSVLIFQVYFRYEYLTAGSSVGVFRIDRLTGNVCVAFPAGSIYRCKSPWR